jgi:5-methyltetrahydrofolate--homocysteine methyltransferase
MLSSHTRKQNRTGGSVMGDNLETISQAVVDGDDKQVVKLVKDALTSGISAMDILDKGLVPGIRALGELFKDGEVYLPEILISTRAMNRGVG